MLLSADSFFRDWCLRISLYSQALIDDIAFVNPLSDFPGYTLMHPSLTRPYLMTEPPLHTDIIHYENIPGFPVVRQNILK